MPARAEEVHHAEEEGIDFEFLADPAGVLGDDKRLGARGPAASGWNWASPTPRAAAGRCRSPAASSMMPCDVVVVAIGTTRQPAADGHHAPT